MSTVVSTLKEVTFVDVMMDMSSMMPLIVLVSRSNVTGCSMELMQCHFLKPAPLVMFVW